jgi:hypothetical protein
MTNSKISQNRIKTLKNYYEKYYTGLIPKRITETWLESNNLTRDNLFKKLAEIKTIDKPRKTYDKKILEYAEKTHRLNLNKFLSDYIQESKPIQSKKAKKELKEEYEEFIKKTTTPKIHKIKQLKKVNAIIEYYIQDSRKGTWYKYEIGSQSVAWNNLKQGEMLLNNIDAFQPRIVTGEPNIEIKQTLIKMGIKMGKDH